MNHLGQSWKTTLVGYILAALFAIQPLLTEEVDFTIKAQVLRYAWRLIVAVGIAILGKYAADSAQVKAVDKRVNDIKNE